MKKKSLPFLFVCLILEKKSCLQVGLFKIWFAFRHINVARSVTGSKELIANLLLNSDNPLPMNGCCVLGGLSPMLEMGVGGRKSLALDQINQLCHTHVTS